MDIMSERVLTVNDLVQYAIRHESNEICMNDYASNYFSIEDYIDFIIDEINDVLDNQFDFDDIIEEISFSSMSNLEFDYDGDIDAYIENNDDEDWDEPSLYICHFTLKEDFLKSNLLMDKSLN